MMTRRDHSELGVSGMRQVTEGENITYTATPTCRILMARMQDATNGATITIADGATSGTTTVPRDDIRRRRYGFRDYHRCNGGNFESLVKDPTAATTTINDDLRCDQ
ncbi:hypothetical protein OK016_19415 [Vibrio chagasii]|nr:hypothetical protein [Vibrio chagasii]